MKPATSHRPRRRRSSGLTLIELIVVISILAILAGSIIPLASNYLASSRVTAAQASLAAVRDAIMGASQHPGYFSDVGQLPTTLRDLFVQPPGVPAFDRNSGLGWRGPYLINPGGLYTINTSKNFIGGIYPAPYGATGDPAMIDPWGNAIILQWPTAGATPADNAQFVRLVSAGPNGVIDTPANYAGSPYPPPSTRGDDIVLFLNHADSP